MSDEYRGFWDDVNERVRANGGPRERAAAILAERTLQEQAGLLVALVDLRARAEADLDAEPCGPDLITYDAEGNRIAQYTMAAMERRRRAKERLDEVKRALDDAFRGDYRAARRLAGS